MWYRGLRLNCGYYRWAREKKAFRRWRITHKEPSGGYSCWLCNKPIEHQAEFSLDHVIPKDLIYTYGLSSWLLFDARNLQPAHKVCNSARSSRVPTYAELQRIPHVSSSLLVEYQTLKRAMRPKATSKPKVVRYLERAGVGQV